MTELTRGEIEQRIALLEGDHVMLDNPFTRKELLAVYTVALAAQEDKKDAKRYRWLRDIGDETWVPMGKRPGIKFSHEIDQAIDAALASGKEGGG